MTETISQDDHDLPSSFSYPAAPAPKRPKKDPKAAADWVPPAAAKPKPSTGNGGVPPPYAENTVPPETPNTLESAFSGDTNSLRNIHESLELLVEGHIKEARGIMSRTVLTSPEDAHVIGDVMFRAKYGIGGRFKRSQPWLSEWMLDKLQALVSVKGKSRDDFVKAWQNSSEERHQRQKQLDEERKRMLGGV